MQCSLQDIFVQHFPRFAAGRKLHWRERRAAQCISQCYTSAMGAHYLVCPAGHVQSTQWHACRHRSCPLCSASSRQRWIDSQMQRLLPCSHFHVVFTLPHSLLALWEFNRAWFIHALFDAVRACLIELLADPRHLGATPGLLMSLHTWGRTLSRHPHVHCLLTAGGLDGNNQWRATRPGWLLPVKPMKSLLRGKLLAALFDRLNSGELTLPPWTTEQNWRLSLKRLYSTPFNVEIRPPYTHGRGVLLYLARYARGGPLGERTHLTVQHDQLLLPYTDHRDGRHKLLRLGVQEFIARLLWHVPPAGVHTLRHVGLYSAAMRQRHAQAAALLRPALEPIGLDEIHCSEVTPSSAAPTQRRPELCSTCHLPLVRKFSAPRALTAHSMDTLENQISYRIDRARHLNRVSHFSTGPPMQ